MDQDGVEVIRCAGCGTKNRVPRSKIGTSAKCGKCHRPLGGEGSPKGPGTFTIRCSRCRAKNRIPADRIAQAANCGKCGSSLDTKILLNGHPVMVSDSNFQETVVNSPLPVLLYCWAPTCPTCQMTGPMIDRFAAVSKGRIRVGKINIQSNPGIASRYNVLGVPFLFVFDNGQLKESLPGEIPEHELMTRMARYL